MIATEKKKWFTILLVLILAFTISACDNDSDDDAVQEDIPTGDIQVKLSIDFPDSEDSEVDDLIMALPDDSSVLDLLWAYANENNLTIETEDEDNPYVKTIGSVSAGNNSGWVFSVNDEETSLSASQYILKNGDEVEWEFIEF